MKLTAFDIKDFKNIKDASAGVGPAVVFVRGKNGAGKSSVLDGILAGLCGKDAVPETPVRGGQGEAVIDLELTGLRVTRTIKADRTTRLKVRYADGTSPPSPQAFLNSLVGRVAFDPLAFATQAPEKQAEVLRDLAGLTGPLGEIDAEAGGVYEERRQVNAALSQSTAELDASGPDSDYDGVPDAAPSAKELLAELDDAKEINSRNASLRKTYSEISIDVRRSYAEVDEAVNEVVRLRGRLAEAEWRHDEYVKDAERVGTAFALARECIDLLADEDTGPLSEAVRQSDTVARKVMMKSNRRATAERVAMLRDEAGRLTSSLERLRRRKAEALEGAAYPLAGLRVEVGDDGRAWVMLAGVPFTQSSTSMKILTGMHVGAALNPKIKLCVVRDGSLLDSASLKVIEDFAREKDFQVLIEMVAESDDGDGLYIEDGTVTRRPPATTPPATTPPATTPPARRTPKIPGLD